MPSLIEIPSQLALQMHTWTAKNWMQYSASHVATTALLLSQNGLRSNSRASNFLGEHAPTPPPSLAFLCMHTYTHTTHPCNPFSTNPGYGPAIDTMVLLLFKNGLRSNLKVSSGLDRDCLLVKTSVVQYNSVHLFSCVLWLHSFYAYLE